MKKTIVKGNKNVGPSKKIYHEKVAGDDVRGSDKLMGGLMKPTKKVKSAMVPGKPMKMINKCKKIGSCKC